MSNNPAGDRPRKKGPRRTSGGDQQTRQPRARGKAGGGRGGDRQGGGGGWRLNREEIEWARDLWLHKEPVDEIAQQLGAPLEEIEALVAGWEEQK